MSESTAGAIVAGGGASFWRDLSLGHVANGLVGFLFAASGPLAIVLAAGTKGGLSEADLASWVFGSLCVNGLVSIIFCLRYRQPLVFFWTIPGTVLIAPALSHLSFAEVVGAYLVTGLLMAALGLAGWVQRTMQAIPMPVVMGMVAGCSWSSVWIGCGLSRPICQSLWP
jgi:benzoate membrane transport protein